MTPCTGIFLLVTASPPFLLVFEDLAFGYEQDTQYGAEEKLTREQPARSLPACVAPSANRQLLPFRGSVIINFSYTERYPYL